MQNVINQISYDCYNLMPDVVKATIDPRPFILLVSAKPIKIKILKVA